MPQKNIAIPKITDEEAIKSLQNNPVQFVEDVLGSSLWSDQRKILEAVRDHPKVAWRSSHGIGKTYIVARLVLWWLFSHPYSIVITTAPTWRQVQDLVWKEIRSAYNQSKIPLGGNLAPTATQLAIDGKEWVALGLSTNDSNRFQGYHAEHLLVVVDEAAGVAEDIFESIMGVLTSAHCRLILIGNPTDVGGQFYRSFRTDGWFTGHTPAWNTPNFTKFGITRDDILSGTWAHKIPTEDGAIQYPFPHLITPKWAEEALHEWGLTHPAWDARVEGEFPTQGEYSVIPLSWIEHAQARWDQTPSLGSITLGVDVARGGMDKSAIAARQGHNKILWIKTYSGLDTQQLAGEVIREYRASNANHVNVDVIGLGAGVVDELKRHKDIRVSEINVASGSTVRDKDGNRSYQNLRAELWWTVREALDPKGDIQLALPPDRELLADLAAPLYDLSKGWIQIEDKSLTKKRLGRSPDAGDAVMLALAQPRKPPPRATVPQTRDEETIKPSWKLGAYS